MAEHHEGLIYAMVLASAADREMTDSELQSMGDMVRNLPVFDGFNEEDLPDATRACAELLNDDAGLENAIEFIRTKVPARLYETAYAISCDIVAADGSASQEELRLLEMIRHSLDIDRLVAAGIERGARARHMPG
jgi:tellurite resistance protein